MTLKSINYKLLVPIQGLGNFTSYNFFQSYNAVLVVGCSMRKEDTMGIIGSIILGAFIIVGIVVLAAIGFGGGIMRFLGWCARKFDEGRHGK